jgi:phosphate transport system substrate-binding protein
MWDKKDTSLVTLALLCAIAAAKQPAAASTFAPVLAQTPAATPLASPTAVPGLTKLRIASSSSMDKFNEALKQRFEQQFPNQQVTIGYADSTAALQAVREEKADLAAIGRPLTRREKARGLVAVPVTRNKIAIIVGANNPFTGSLTDQQFAKIFRGEIQDWSEVGGAPGGIRVIDRPETSDIRQTLRQYPVFRAARFDTGANVVKLSEDTTQAVIRELGTDGISIATADQVLNQPGVRVLPMHKTTPDDPRYPFSQGLFYVYKKTNTNAALQNFLSYATAPQGQSALAEARTVLAAATPAAIPLPTTATPGATIPPQAIAPAATPFPTTATPGATIPPQAIAPAATPFPTTIPPQAATTAATASPQTTPLPPAAADASAGTSVSDKVIFDLWWVWFSGLLAFLVWKWLKSKESQPQTNQHLSLSSLDQIQPTESPTLERAAAPTLSLRKNYPFSVSSDTETNDNQTKDIAIATSGPVTGAEITPSAAITEEESSPIATQVNQSNTESVSDIPPATSGLVGSSEITPSAAITEEESSPIATQVNQSNTEPVSDIPPVTSGLVGSSEITPSAAITETEEESSQPTPSTASALTQAETSGLVTDAEIAPSQPITAEQESFPEAAIPLIATSGLVAWSEIATKGDIASSKPIALEESSPTVSDLTRETPEAVSDITEPKLIAIGHQVEDTTSATDAPPPSAAVAEGEIAEEGEISRSQPIAVEESFPTASQLTPETPADVSPVTEDTTSTISFPIGAAAIATGAAMLSDQPAVTSDSSTAAAETPTVGDESTIVLLSNQPEWAYSHWNIANQQKERLRQEGVTKLTLRLYDVTDIDLNNQQPQSIQQHDCSEDSRDAYWVIPARDRDYMVEIGYVAESDRWIELARSPVVRIPPASVEDLQLADVEFEAMRLMSVPPVSPEILSSSGGRLGVTNLLDTSENSSSDSTKTTRHSKFRLVGDAELSVYGETEPDAKVTIDGRQIELNPTGTFRCQMLCPDGESDFTITAVAADGETDSIQIKLTRQTLKPNSAQLQ